MNEIEQINNNIQNIVLFVILGKQIICLTMKIH